MFIISVFVLLAVLFFSLSVIFYKYIVSKNFDPFNPLLGFNLFFLIFFIIKPIVLYFEDQNTSDDPAYSLAIIYATLYVISVYAGFFFKSIFKSKKYSYEFRAEFPCNRKFLIFAILYGIIGWSIVLVSYAKIIATEGLLVMLSPIVIQNKYFKIGGGHLLLGFSLISLSAILLYSYSLKVKKSKVYILSFIYFILSALSMLFIGTRWPIIQMFLIRFVIYYYYKGLKFNLKQLIILAPLFTLLLYLLSILNSFRKGYFLYKEEVDLGFLQNIVNTIKEDTNPYDNLVKLIQEIEFGELELSFGLYFLYILLVPIPRFIFQDKPPISVEYHLTKELFGWDPLEGATMTFTILGDIYYSYYIPGILIGGLITGLILDSVYKSVLYNKKNILVLIAYAYFLMIFYNSLRTTTQSLIFALVYILPFLGFIYIIVKQK